LDLERRDWEEEVEDLGEENKCLDMALVLISCRSESSKY